MTAARPRRGPVSALRGFLVSESAGGIVLIVAAVLALGVANSALAHDYHALLATRIGPLDVHGWINDALMALFFLLVGLEIKRELVDGHLATWGDRALPAIAAGGGMAVPALVYLAMVAGTPGLARGWAIPAATDIAFAIGVLALLGRHAPASLKLFLTTVAIVDDMGAVAIIAVFYTAHLDALMLAACAVPLAALFALNRANVALLWPYLAAGALLWLGVFQSGIHPTVAGVVTALFVPVQRTPGALDAAHSALHRLEHGLARWSAFGVVPLFAFVNAGVTLDAGAIGARLPLAVALALVLGKQAGVFASVRLAVAAGIARRPRGASWTQLWGVSLLAGIGFTMSLFIGGLAFSDARLIDEVKLGVLGGSLLSALAGYAVLRLASAKRL